MTAPAGSGTWLAAGDPTSRRSVPLRVIAAPPPEQPIPAPVQVPCAPGSRQGRSMQLVVAAAVTLAVIGGLVWPGQTAGSRIPAETGVVRVGAGETLWDVAQRVAPESDPRAVVDRIRQLNGMMGSAVQPGQQLKVPEGG